MQGKLPFVLQLKDTVAIILFTYPKTDKVLCFQIPHAAGAVSSLLSKSA
jgi:hypothetical protein